MQADEQKKEKMLENIGWIVDDDNLKLSDEHDG